MKLGVGDVSGVVHENADFRVTLDTGDRVDEDAFGHGGKRNYPNLSWAPSSFGSAPASAWL
jgi:hypothetical protein